MRCCSWSLAVVGAWLAWFTVAIAADAPNISFDRDVAPLLARRCLDCHNGTEKKGGLDLSRLETTTKGGKSGAAIVSSKAAESLLWQRVRDGEMPPKKPLPKAEVELLRQWIDAGAKWGTSPIDPFASSTGSRAGYDWWSLLPVVRPELPDFKFQISDSKSEISDLKLQSTHPIDRFVGKKLADEGLAPSAMADRRMLIRRLSFDLIGLPPTPQQVAAFEKDDAPDAYDKLVNQLLDSPHFGERWARHWLDIIRYGESQGFERDKIRNNSWRYRDWLVTAFNRDLPYDEFVRLQLAGDVLRPEDPNAVIATGFLVAGAYDDVGQSQQSAAMRAVVRQDEMEDYVATVGETFLGLTVHCARCHDHKFDPILSRDYYRVAAALAGVKPGDRDLPNLKSGISNLKFDLPDFKSALQRELDSLLAKQAAIDAEAKANGDVTADKQQSSLKFEIEHLRKQLARATENRAYALAPKKPEPTYVLHRGSTTSPGEEVSAGGVSAVGYSRSPVALQQEKPSANSANFSQSESATFDADFQLAKDATDGDRRKALATWITDRRNPLFARVIVNRLWQYHFGAGLVETSSDFGFNGGRPSHPELLDWLASELMDHDWSLKHIHRLIVTSATYRQSSRPRVAAAKQDAGNRWLWRKSPVRLDAEVMRDSVLAIAGDLNRDVGGPGYHDFTTFTFNSQFYDIVDPVGHSFARRSLYRAWVRSGRNPFLEVFDCPDPSTKTPRRAVTTTPLQALSLLNNSFMLRMSDRLAERVRHDAGDDLVAQLNRAALLTYGRSASADELAVWTEFAKTHGLPALARVLLNSNEFLYVE